MPKLPTPVSDPKLPQPIFTAASQGATVANANAGLAQDIQQFGGVLHQRQVQSEISALTADMATAQAELALEWEETLRTDRS